MGTLGSFQGYVDSPLWLYNHGVWSNLQQPGITVVNSVGKSKCEEITGGIRLTSGTNTNDLCNGRLKQSIDLTPYKYVNFSVNSISFYVTGIIGVSSNANAAFGAYDASISFTTQIDGKVDISNISGNKFIYFQANNRVGREEQYIIDEIFLTNV